MAFQTDGIVWNNKEIKSNYYLLEIDCPSIANEAKPGQFVMVQTSEDHHPLLRRPFSIYKSYSTRHPRREMQGHLFILYKIVGKGTQRMTTFQKGQTVNLLGPLGNGFALPALPSPSPTILIGGGIGMASLSAISEAINPDQLYVFIGGRTQNDILCENDFPNGKIFIATEDGSLGKRGTVVDLFKSELNRFDKAQPHHLYICGPEGMLKSLSKVIPSVPWFVQVSLEARMGCGFGACWGCVVKTKDAERLYRRVCKEGPVFPLSKIAWE